MNETSKNLQEQSVKQMPKLYIYPKQAIKLSKRTFVHILQYCFSLYNILLRYIKGRKNATINDLIHQILFIFVFFSFVKSIKYKMSFKKS